MGTCYCLFKSRVLNWSSLCVTYCSTILFEVLGFSSQSCFNRVSKHLKYWTEVILCNSRTLHTWTKTTCQDRVFCYDSPLIVISTPTPEYLHRFAARLYSICCLQTEVACWVLNYIIQCINQLQLLVDFCNSSSK